MLYQATQTQDDLTRLFERLWQDYVARLCPSARQVHALLAHGGAIVNDHIALRTFNLPPLALDVVAAPFMALGYEAKEEYQFVEKKLRAKYYQHPDPSWPKLFISELRVELCSSKLQRQVEHLLAACEVKRFADPAFLYSGRPWPLTQAQYYALAQESDYAAWVAAHGFGANHFTVSVDDLASCANDAWTLTKVNQILVDAGFNLNRVGGAIKGSPTLGLEQSATMADSVTVDFDDGTAVIPGGFYEFACRYEIDGVRFQGFIPDSANAIFDSTSPQTKKPLTM
ncbi:DUF1338 domain-containing protein [Vibrio sp. SM6]|uniref:2-oxoadipate dioxygenase/decarboxylase n=1 Tax=Vibrio agarilyticus TaxID=2726741 RepID=A0A7X8TTT7_9VIBR|nr:DUF1338 domain-containing protein [Vibrio agarilyticus]NLS14670.1 DUF1338 domain-containing protein [Vibrio agarilyticus]